MNKKKITGQSKLADVAASEQEQQEQVDKPEIDNKVSPKNLKNNEAKKKLNTKILDRKILEATSFRLNGEDKKRLKAIQDTLNSLSPNVKISESLIIKALLLNGEKLKPERLLSLVREVIF